MIEQRDVAKEVSELMLNIGARLDASLVRIKERCSAAEFEAYRKAVGKIMGEMLLEVMNPLYQKHPDLKPKELK
jgi:hypothetical protein